MTQTTRVNPSQQSTYHALIADATLVPARLFWVERNGEMVRRAWSELTTTERVLQNEADRRAAEIAAFDPCGMEVYS